MRSGYKYDERWRNRRWRCGVCGSDLSVKYTHEDFPNDHICNKCMLESVETGFCPRPPPAPAPAPAPATTKIRIHRNSCGDTYIHAKELYAYLLKQVIWAKDTGKETEAQVLSAVADKIEHLTY